MIWILLIVAIVSLYKANKIGDIEEAAAKRRLIRNIAIIVFAVWLFGYIGLAGLAVWLIVHTVRNGWPNPEGDIYND